MNCVVLTYRWHNLQRAFVWEYFFFHSSSFLPSSDAFYLSVPENYHYLNQSGCIVDKTISDKDSFKEVIVSCFTNSLKNARGADTWGQLMEQRTKAFCTYLCSLWHSGSVWSSPRGKGLKFSDNTQLTLWACLCLPSSICFLILPFPNRLWLNYMIMFGK